MATPVYATSAEFTASVFGRSPAPADINARLVKASLRIDELAAAAVYDIDGNEYPTDTDIREAFRQATIAQADWGIDHGDDGSAGQYQTLSIGSVTLTRASGPNGPTTNSDYAPLAATILRQAGLRGIPVWVV